MIKNKIKLKVNIIQTFKNNIVIKRGIINHIGDNHMKCLKNIVITKTKGIINIMYIVFIEYHKFDNLFMKFDKKSIFDTFEFFRSISIKLCLFSFNSFLREFKIFFFNKINLESSQSKIIELIHFLFAKKLSI